MCMDIWHYHRSKFKVVRNRREYNICVKYRKICKVYAFWRIFKALYAVFIYSFVT